MKILILDYSQCLRGFGEQDPRIICRDDDALTPPELVAFAASLDDLFVIVWHKDARSAIHFVAALDPCWPANLCGCVFFSSQPHANALATHGSSLKRFETAKRILPKTRSSFVHFLESGVPKNLNVNDHFDLWGLLYNFFDYVLDSDQQGPVSFDLLEAPKPEEQNLRERILHLTASDGRHTKSTQAEIDCPFCPLRAAIHHPLQRLLRDQIPSISRFTELLNSKEGKRLVEVLSSPDAQKNRLISSLLLKARINSRDQPSRKKLDKRVDTVFHTCTVINRTLADTTLSILDQLEHFHERPLELIRLMHVVDGSLQCPNQTNHKVLL